MPETPVNENNLYKPPEYQIGLAGKIRRMQAVTEAHRVDHSPHSYLRSRIHAMHAGHVGAAFGGAQFIHGYCRAANQPFTCSLRRSSGSVPSRRTAS